MAKVTFNLVYDWDRSDHIVKSFNALRDCVTYIRLHVNDARKYYIVEELVDGEEVDCCNAYYLLDAYYLLEKYKNLDTLPLTLTDC